MLEEYKIKEQQIVEHAVKGKEICLSTGNNYNILYKNSTSSDIAITVRNASTVWKQVIIIIYNHLYI